MSNQSLELEIIDTQLKYRFKYHLKDKFCIRNELNTTRTRLMELEKDLLSSREQCIQLTEQINKQDAEV